MTEARHAAAAALFLALALAATAQAQRPSAVVADHARDRLDRIPDGCIDQARARFRMSYGHTSHGSQVVTGMSLLMSQSPLYSYNADGSGGALSLWDATPPGDLGNPDRVSWAQRTRELLATTGQDRNLVWWSWCGQVSDATVSDIADSYLGQMDRLERDYPAVTFVYMTGHLDGTGEAGNLHQRNEQIRQYCRSNHKVLFDFADIESFDPDGNYYVDRDANDNCDYQGGNWAVEWCAAHPGECGTCGCAHSQCLNCQRKGRAFWWLLARLVGGDACVEPVASLKLTKAGADARLAWDARSGVYGYNAWYVTTKEDVSRAGMGTAPPARGVAGCVAPTPALGTSCPDPGALAREPGTAFYYQVRTHCCGDVEGP